MSITAEHGSYGFGIDDVVFRLRRAGPADEAISVRVSLAQAHPYLPAGRLNAVVRFWAGRRDAELRFRARQFNGPATQSGVLSATLVAASAYTVGYPDSARTRLVVKDPAITIRPEQDSYTVDRDDGAVRVNFVARTEGELPRPGKAFSMAVSSKAKSDETAARARVRETSRTIAFEPRDFAAEGGEWEARKTVSIPMAEGDEGLEVRFQRAGSTPERIRPRNSDGTPCTDDVCMVPVFMAAGDGPILTIAAEQDSYGYGIDDIGFVVTAAEPRDEAVEATVTLTQEDGYLAQDNLSQTVRIEPGRTSARLVFLSAFQPGTASRSGALTATIATGDGYAVGSPGAATTRIVVLDPAITVRPERAAYRFVEGEAEAKVAFVARTEAGLPRPNRAFEVLIVASPNPEGASVPADFAYIRQDLAFEPGDFRPDGRQWVARKEVALEIRGDGETEPDELFNVLLLASSSTPPRVQILQADGGACTGNQCLVPVTIVDDPGQGVGRIAITPVPPEASADHGPFYRMDDFLALPDGAVHGPGATLTFTLTLDTEVTVTGSPELVLDIYDRERRARYTGGSGTRQLTFTWTVAKGDNDPDGLDFVSLDLNGGTIRDTQGNNFVPQTLPAQRFAEHRVRGGLHAMRLEVSGSAREGEPFEIRVVRNGGYDEPAVAIVGVTDSALQHIPQLYSPALNGPGVRTLDFGDGEPSEPGVRTSIRTVTPPGDGVADASRTLTVRLVITDAGIYQHAGHRIRAWYLAEEPLEVTVPVVDTGQPLALAGLRVHETSTAEAPGAKLVFRVTLSPRSEAPVTVDYRTADDRADEYRAVAGSDYVATGGTLTFQPGETEKRVEVEVLADDHDEGYESMRLVLSNAQGARIDKGSGIGVIRNTGPIPKAWIARFGRTVADQVLGAVESRMRTGRRPGVEMTLAGHRVGAKTGADGQDPAANPGATAGLSDWLGGGRNPLWRDGSGLRLQTSRSLAQRDLLSGTSFAVTAETGRRETVSLWGRGAVTRFDGRQGSLSLDGEVTSGMVGADWSRDPGTGSGAGAWTAGMIVAHNVANGDYAGNSAGRIETTLTGLYPWGRLALSGRTEIWGAAGYGTGELAVTPKQPGTGEYGSTIRADLDLWMAAAGLRGVLMDGGQDGLTLTGKTDALIVQTASDAARGSDGGNLAAARATVTRLRLGMEAERPFGLGRGGTLTPSAAIGMRHDDGDAERGFGVDLGGGLAWIAPKYGLQVELRGRGLLTHEAKGFRERGFSGALAWDPKPSTARGPTMALTQTVGGPASGGADALLERGAFAGLAAQPVSGSRGGLLHRKMEIRFGYGFPAWGGRFASVPEIGLGFSGTGREYILGWRLAGEGPAGPGTFRLSAEARRLEVAAGARSDEHRVGIRLSARW
ncbi:MAG: hypothetical protein OXC10_05730 [Rhodospirillaceae bacterium]|nr:hypothetical protein [Rhodospirillaceae bacterium]